LLINQYVGVRIVRQPLKSLFKKGLQRYVIENFLFYSKEIMRTAIFPHLHLKFCPYS